MQFTSHNQIYTFSTVNATNNQSQPLPMQKQILIVRKLKFNTIAYNYSTDEDIFLDSILVDYITEFWNLKVLKLHKYALYML